MNGRKFKVEGEIGTNMEILGAVLRKSGVLQTQLRLPEHVARIHTASATVVFTTSVNVLIPPRAHVRTRYTCAIYVFSTHPDKRAYARPILVFRTKHVVARLP